MHFMVKQKILTEVFFITIFLNERIIVSVPQFNLRGKMLIEIPLIAS